MGSNELKLCQCRKRVIADRHAINAQTIELKVRCPNVDPFLDQRCRDILGSSSGGRYPGTGTIRRIHHQRHFAGLIAGRQHEPRVGRNCPGRNTLATNRKRRHTDITRTTLHFDLDGITATSRPDNISPSLQTTKPHFEHNSDIVTIQ